MDARTATSKAETTFHTGDVEPDENAHRGQLADSEWWVDDEARRPLISFMLHRMSPLLAQSGHSATEFQCLLLGVKRTLI